MQYDNIIVGGGPTGITLAFLLKDQGKTLLIEREGSLGGCHRVVRSNNHFTEHSPRVYMGNYLNWQNLLLSMGYKHDDYFRRYKFGSGSGFNLIIKTLSSSELMKLTGAFGMLMINPSFGKNQSVGDYCKNFTPKSLDVLDRICRLTDGADINSYSLWAFLNLFNMNAFYSIYQPKEPLDQKLWPDIQKKLSCDFAFNTTVHSIIRYKGYFTVNQYIGKRVFIAVPPTALSHIFPNHRALRTFANKTAYLPYIQMTISWHKKLKKQFNKDNTNDWGNVVGPWGLIWIQLTDYMTMEFPTVLTLSISKQHIKGINGYTAGNATKEQLIKEVLDELSNVFENFCPPSLVIFNPLLYNERNERNERNEWHTNDAAYVKKPNVSALPSRLAENLYTVGWHNDNGTLAFSTLENAVVSAKVLLNELGIQTNQTKIVRPVTIRHVILIILFMILLLFLYLLLKPLIKPLIKPIIGDVNLIRNKLYQRF